MSRSVSTSTLAILLFFTFFTIFASAAPTNTTCDEFDKDGPGKVKDVPVVVEDPPEVDSSTNSTVVDDGTTDSDVVNLDDVNTLATTTYSGTVRRFSNWRSTALLHTHNTPLYPRRCVQATWFYVGLGACGVTNKDSDFIVALAQPNWGGGSNCGKVRSTPFFAGSNGTPYLVTLSLVQKLQITNPANKRTQTAIVRDLCPSCPSGNLGESRPPSVSGMTLTFLSRLDLSPSLFKALADDLGLGVFKMTWKYV